MVPLQKTFQLFFIVWASFTLGMYSVEFSGSVWAWTAVVCSVVVGILALFLIIRDFWKPDPRRL
jgi:hypothetical protein